MARPFIGRALPGGLTALIRSSRWRTVAENLLRDELKRKADGLAASPDPLRCLVDDLLGALENRYQVEGRRSLERLQDSITHLLRLFRGVPAAQVRGNDVLRYATLRMEECAAAATVNRELAALRAAYRLGLDNDVIVAMPRIRLLPENNARKGFADAGQVEPSAATSSLRWPMPCGSCSSPAGGAGPRSCASREPGTTKTPLIAELRRLLERRQEHTRRCERAQGRTIPEVFHRYGRPIRSMRRAWMTACRKAGRPGLLLHDLRRSAVRNLERAGVSRSVAMKLTVHKTENVYRRYAIVAESDLREGGAKLAALPDGSRSVTHPGQIR